MWHCNAVCLLIVTSMGYASAFAPVAKGIGMPQNLQLKSFESCRLAAHAAAAEFVEPDDVPFFLKPYKDMSGQVVNPYHVLQVSRTASVAEIKRAYRSLSRKFHPDMVRQNSSRMSPEEARNEFERVRFSYEILKDRTSRVRYDRCELLAGPGAALGRAALHVMGRSFQDSGKLAVVVGGFALDQVGKMLQYVSEEVPVSFASVERLGMDQSPMNDQLGFDPFGWVSDAVPRLLGIVEEKGQETANLVDMGKQMLESIAPQLPTLDW